MVLFVCIFTMLLQLVAVKGFQIPPHHNHYYDNHINHINHCNQKIISNYNNNNVAPNSYITTISQQRQQPSSSSSVILKMSSSFNNNDNYDMTKPIFDLYTFRTIRNDALNRYNVLNQSEPLRINLFLFISFIFYSLPFLPVDIIPTTVGDGMIPLTPTVVASFSILGGIGSTVLAIRECQKRSKQLYRIEKELQALSLSIRLPTTNVFSDLPYDKSATISSILRKKPCRIVAISGSASELKQNLELLQVLGTTRLQQANTFIVVIPTDGSKRSDWLQQVSVEQQPQQRIPWLAEPSSIDEWKDYLNSLSLSASSTTTASPTFRWFGLNTNGMSFGSGTTAPSWLQIMGRSLLPMDIFIDDDSNDSNIRDMDPAASTSSTTKETILALQQKFYTALTTGDTETMVNDVFQPGMEDDEVTQIIHQGGRLDTWDSCLQDNARPEGMKMVGSDFAQLSDTFAYTTIIECPQATSSSSNSAPRRTVGTLLAIQKWMLLPSSELPQQQSNMDHDNSNKLGEWKLVKHQTIPWMADTPAGGILLCDCRGCVSLVRSTK